MEEIAPGLGIKRQLPCPVGVNYLVRFERRF